MKRIFTLLLAGFLSTGLFAQYPLVQVSDINDASPADLANCSDTSSYYMDTVTVVGYVVTDGGLAEVASSSVNGANGIRPFIFLNDTANGGQVGPNSGLEVMGVNWNTSQATSGFTSLISGDLVEITGVVGMFSSATQFQPLDNSSITILPSNFPTFTPAEIGVDELNDQNQVNNLVTGERWEAVFVEVKNVTVTTVNQFGSGTGARFEFTVSDSLGNSMQVYDFFVAQRLSSWPTLNPNSPYSNGIFTPPSVGTFFTSLKGVIEHSGNGCTGGTGQGYRLHPFDSTHYEVGEAFPSFQSVSNDPSVPGNTDSITVNADVIDPDGSIDSVHIFWSADTSVAPAAYTKNTMSLTSGSTYSFTIDPQPNNTIISYYIRAVDNNQNVSYYPATPSGQANNVALIYVRNEGLSIMDVQTPLSGTNDASPFDGQEVTVRGFVTAAMRDCDLGYVYLQDTSSNEYAGIGLRGSLDLANLYRNEYAEVTGTVQESFGYTQLIVQSITPLGATYEVQPIELDPSDASDLDNFEKYESMLVTYRDPIGGSLYVTDPDLGFGEYAISSDQNPAGTANERRVLAGRQTGSSAQSSLYVQLVSDSSYANNDGSMFYPPIVTNTGITMDAMTGIMWYSFGTFKLTPRNNFDIENLSETLDTAGCVVPTNVSISEVSNPANVKVYPNPATDRFTVEGTGKDLTVIVYDMKGSEIARQESGNSTRLEFDASRFRAGFYILKVSGIENSDVGTFKIIITE